MQIDIQTRNFGLTQALRNHAERRLRFALTSAGNHVQRIIVRLSDINGPRGGEDKNNAVIHNTFYAAVCDATVTSIDCRLLYASAVTRIKSNSRVFAGNCVT